MEWAVLYLLPEALTTLALSEVLFEKAHWTSSNVLFRRGVNEGHR